MIDEGPKCDHTERSHLNVVEVHERETQLELLLVHESDLCTQSSAMLKRIRKDNIEWHWSNWRLHAPVFLHGLDAFIRGREEQVPHRHHMYVGWIIVCNFIIQTKHSYWISKIFYQEFASARQSFWETLLWTWTFPRFPEWRIAVWCRLLRV